MERLPNENTRMRSGFAIAAGCLLILMTLGTVINVIRFLSGNLGINPSISGTLYSIWSYFGGLILYILLTVTAFRRKKDMFAFITFVGMAVLVLGNHLLLRIMPNSTWHWLASNPSILKGHPEVLISELFSILSGLSIIALYLLLALRCHPRNKLPIDKILSPLVALLVSYVCSWLNKLTGRNLISSNLSVSFTGLVTEFITSLPAYLIWLFLILACWMKPKQPAAVPAAAPVYGGYQPQQYGPAMGQMPYAQPFTPPAPSQAAPRQPWTPPAGYVPGLQQTPPEAPIPPVAPQSAPRQPWTPPAGYVPGLQQTPPAAAPQPAPAQFQSEDAARELAALKQLLDCGLISQEDFDAKRRQILGL